jgi:hypothetical protein
MIENIQMHYQQHGCETCVATLEVEVEGRTIVRTLDFSGNSIPDVLSGAVRVVNELQELLGQKPQGFIKTPTTKKAR